MYTEERQTSCKETEVDQPRMRREDRGYSVRKAVLRED